jgi:hypothetical protein
MDVGAEGGVARAETRGVTVAMWEIAQHPAEPGTIVMRDERGCARFASSDGGRSWQRLDGDAAAR